METRIVFCSACDRNVPMGARASAREGRRPSAHHIEDAMVCLDYGVRCTGAMCPLFALPEAPRAGAVRPPVPSGHATPQARVE